VPGKAKKEGFFFVLQDFLKQLLFKRVDIDTIRRVMIFSFQCWYWRCTKKMIGCAVLENVIIWESKLHIVLCDVATILDSGAKSMQMLC
jgi:hypothetical protein